MKKTINLLFAAIALLLIGYYFGSYHARKNIKSEEQKPLLLNQVANPVKEVITYNDDEERYVSFKIHMIGASMNTESVDPELQEIKKMFDSVTPFSEFKLIKSQTVRVKVGEKGKIVLPNNQFLYFMPQGVRDLQLALNLRIPWILNINLKIRNGEGFFQGGLKFKERFMILYIEPVF